MRLFRHIPIKRKLTLITLLTSGVALLLASVAFVAWELVVFRKTMVNGALITAEMVGYNSCAALSFDDPASAAETLKSLHADPHIMGGAVYRKDGTLFATYQRAQLNEPFHPPAVEPDGHRFMGNSLRLFRSIHLAGENIGTVCLQLDLDEMVTRLWRYAFIVVIVMIGASFVAFLLSTRMLTVISGPILHLAEVVGVVAREKDYSVRAVKQDNDELGRLMDGFNEMLIQIQARDEAIHESRELYQKLALNTNDLPYVVDLSNARVEWHGEIDHALGYAPQGFPRTVAAWAECIHPEDREAVCQAYRQSCEQGTGFAEEYR
ncbi:MAG: PAS domain-containing protein, partial [Verrucomicrobia bacterium]|nr:PAS domain-containing protein [Verrucomicrobiota bacterium]